MGDPTLLAFPNTGDLPPCTCDGQRGWTIVERDGREVARRCLRCHRQQLVRQFGGQLRTWASWVRRPELEQQVNALRAWRGIEWSCLLSGGPGTGKTHALQAVGHEWLARGLDVRYAVVPEYLDRVRESFGDDTLRVPDLEDFDGLLILDELGLGKDSAWVSEVLERAIGFRYRSNLPTLLASNADLNVLGVRFPRLTDRLFEGLLLHWEASSWRRR